MTPDMAEVFCEEFLEMAFSDTVGDVPLMSAIEDWLALATRQQVITEHDYGAFMRMLVRVAVLNAEPIVNGQRLIFSQDDLVGFTLMFEDEFKTVVRHFALRRPDPISD